MGKSRVVFCTWAFVGVTWGVGVSKIAGGVELEAVSIGSVAEPFGPEVEKAPEQAEINNMQAKT